MLLFLANNLFGTFLTYKMAGILLRKLRISLRACIVFYLVYYIINSTVYFWYGNHKITLISNYVCLYIIVFFVYDEYIWKKILVPLLLAAVGFCTEEMFWYLLMGFFKTPSPLLVGILSNFTFCIILAVLQVHFRHGVNDLHPRHINLLLIALPVTSMAIVLTFEINHSSELMAAGISGIVFLNIGLFFLYEQLVKACRKEMEQRMLSQRIRQYENQLELMRESVRRITSIRHDMKNHIIVLKRLIGDEKMAEAGVYLEQMGDAVETQGEYAKTGNDVIDSILNYYADEAQGLGAGVELQLQVPAALPIAPLDISIILGNLMQNAVEALRDCSGEKNLKVSFKMDKGALRLVITNTYKGGPLISPGKGLKTTKPAAAEHGYGLENVRESIKKYDGEMECRAEEGRFEVNVFILSG